MIGRQAKGIYCRVNPKFDLDSCKKTREPLYQWFDVEGEVVAYTGNAEELIIWILDADGRMLIRLTPNRGVGR